MKKKIGFWVIISYLALMIILQIVYQVQFRVRIPEQIPERAWTAETVLYPRQVTDRLADCFFGISYFLFGYLLFEHLYYYGRMEGQEGKNRVKIWRVLTVLCQMGAFCVYAVLWLGYTNFPQFPVRKVHDFILDYLFEYLSEGQLEEFQGGGFQRPLIYLALVIAPMIMYLIIYIVHFLVRCWQLWREDCVSKGWRNWNIVYIVFLCVVLFWAYDSQDFFSILEQIPLLRNLRPFLMPPH